MDIIMVHGFWDTGKIYRRMANHLSEEGHICHAPDLKPANAANGLGALAEQLDRYVDENVGRNESIAIIGFSMGAIIARQYIQNLGAAARTKFFFAISGPHGGTLSAHFWLGKAARDMRFSSDFLRNLNRDLSVFDKIEVHSYRTPFDLLIIPSTSSHIDWAENHIIPTPFHHQMVVQQQIFDHIAGRLRHSY